ncbi:hypothetical protein SERLA73DRAFT_188561 [Serpula lacrymans var. lacrymans S7.3]|uniref:Uncharacterized protein n=2 Tax=Serpula lacrymans var. lacrymans TaxID=341189 RepID=F8QBJ8_SERL3|nr:uncharacterized protein SERLADRAFT_478716 [Serpula lacrymans var. lacrymans S7.9]EGN94584.1 hypothetical protein SERLA73DRAFT_188561 [Serpula lacrymans var. lacrymans S7.3]EGO20060.1 hypothetical protein SERLADRAFT_478716 [Serpula lacrymans var. lacrymans S7.9]
MSTASGIPLDTAAIASTVLEGILYGFSVLMYVGTIWSLTNGRKKHDVNMKMVAIASALLVLSTVHMIMDIIRVEEGLVQYRDTFPGGPNGFFADVAQWSFVYKNVIYTLQTLLGDGVVIYRCYVVWQSAYIIIFPMIMWCSVATTGIGCVYTLSKATTDSNNIFSKETGQWITAYYASTLATNLIGTILLAFRIWSVDRNVSNLRSRRSSLGPLLLIIIDAGVLYSVTLLGALVCFVSANRGQYVLLDMIMPIISIAFYMVIIRVGISKRHGGLHSTTGRSASHSQMLQDQQQYSMKRVQVHITKLTETNEDGTPFTNDDLSGSRKMQSYDEV